MGSDSWLLLTRWVIGGTLLSLFFSQFNFLIFKTGGGEDDDDDNGGGDGDGVDGDSGGDDDDRIITLLTWLLWGRDLIHVKEPAQSLAH